jgi:transcriptional regulator GlxA family with amidase domain
MRKIGFVVAVDFQMMSVAALSVFEFANLTAPEPVYEVEVLSESGGPVRSSMGMAVETRPLGEPPSDTLIFSGGTEAVQATSALTDFALRALKTSRRVASICTGAFVLAEAGILDGRRATTHWHSARDLQQRFPQVKVDEDRIFIVDGPVWTSAGASAGIDLALGMVEADLGEEIARLVAKKLVIYHRRAGGQSQHSAMLDLHPKSDRIQTALDYARSNLRKPLSVEELAEAAHLSPRQFSRAFTAETGQSPAKAIENIRVEAARFLMEQGRHTIDAVADETGFGDRERMRRAFLRAFGQPPQAIRRSARGVGA